RVCNSYAPVGRAGYPESSGGVRISCVVNQVSVVTEFLRWLVVSSIFHRPVLDLVEGVSPDDYRPVKAPFTRNPFHADNLVNTRREGRRHIRPSIPEQDLLPGTQAVLERANLARS